MHFRLQPHSPSCLPLHPSLSASSYQFSELQTFQVTGGEFTKDSGHWLQQISSGDGTVSNHIVFVSTRITAVAVGYGYRLHGDRARKEGHEVRNSAASSSDTVLSFVYAEPFRSP